jgi:hypothetical protein
VLPDKPLERIPTSAQLFKEPNIITAVGVTPTLMQESGQARAEPTLFGIQINGNPMRITTMAMAMYAKICGNEMRGAVLDGIVACSYL